MEKRDVQRAYERLSSHEAVTRYLDLVPRLKVTKYSSPKNRHGTAVYGPRRPEVRINLWDGLDEASIEETIIHELAHHTTKARYSERGHGHGFQWEMDRLFEAIHPEAVRYLRPRRNRYHGRYADALRESATVAEAARTANGIDDLLDDSATLQEAAQRLLAADEPVPAAAGAIDRQLVADILADDKPSVLDRVFFGQTPEQVRHVMDPYAAGFLTRPRRSGGTRVRETTSTLPPGTAPRRGVVARGYYRQTRDEAVWHAVNISPGREARPADVARSLGISEGQVRHALWRLRNDGRATNHRRGWWRTAG